MRRLTSLLLVSLMLLGTSPVFAQERQPFQKGVVGIEGSVAPLIESWNLNGHASRWSK